MNEQLAEGGLTPGRKKINNEDSTISFDLFDNGNPLKIRKLALLDFAGLPIEHPYIFSRQHLGDLLAFLQSEASSSRLPIAIRTACSPDRSKSPFFYLDSADELPETVRRIESLIREDGEIQFIIAQHATPKTEIQNKFVGRILFNEDPGNDESEIVLELYRGARSMRALEVVSADDPSFSRYMKRPGEFLKKMGSSSDDESAKMEREIIMALTKTYQEQIAIVRELFLKMQPKKNRVVSLEFWYLNGQIFFGDID